MGALIKQNMKIAKKIAEKKDDDKYKKNSEKKENNNNKNSILYNIIVHRVSTKGNPLHIEFQNWIPGGYLFEKNLLKIQRTKCKQFQNKKQFFLQELLYLTL